MYRYFRILLCLAAWPTHAHSQIGGTIICAQIVGDTIIVAADSRMSFRGLDTGYIGYADSFPKFFPFYNGIAGTAGEAFWNGKSFEKVLKDFMDEHSDETDFLILVSKFIKYINQNYPVTDITLKKYQHLIFVGYTEQRPVIILLDRGPTTGQRSSFSGNGTTEGDFTSVFDAYAQEHLLQYSIDLAAAYEDMIVKYALNRNDTIRIGGPISLALLLKPSLNSDKPNIHWIKNNLLNHSYSTAEEVLQYLESDKAKLVPIYPYGRKLILQIIKDRMHLTH